MRNDINEVKNIEFMQSVKFGINAKLQYSAEIKVYALTADEALKEATRIAKDVEELIRVKNNETKR